MIQKNVHGIMNFLVRNRGRFNINEIARHTNISVGGTYNALKNLKEKGVLKKDVLGNAVFYYINLENDEAQKLSELVLIENREKTLKSIPLADIYANEIIKWKGFAKTCIIFGSILKTEKPRDIDVLFVAEKEKIKELRRLCLALSRRRNKTISPLFMTSRDFKKNVKGGDEVIADIIKTGIILWGESVIFRVMKNEQG